MKPNQQAIGLLTGFAAFMLAFFTPEAGQTPGMASSAPVVSPTPESYFRVPPVLPEATATPESFIAELTWYTCSVDEGTKECITASGTPAGPGTAASIRLPYGTHIQIDGQRYTVTDRGGGLRESDIDLWSPSKEEALKKGRRQALVTIERGDREE